MMKWMLIILLLPVVVYAQEFQFQQEYNTIPVEINGWHLYQPWVGGYSYSQPAFADIDADSDFDCFIGHWLRFVDYYRNQGTIYSPNFWVGEIHWDSVSCFSNNSHSNPDFWDLDGDGDKDLLIGAGYVRYYRNEGTVFSPNFDGFSDTLFDTQGNWVFGTHVSLVDIDADGDGDMVCGEWLGHLQFYRNIGTADSFAFHLEGNPWLGINLGYSVDADPTFCDIDGDNDLDLFIGSEYGYIYFYRNDGDSSQYNFTYVINTYAGINVGGYASPEFADLDGDGDYDLLVGRGLDSPSSNPDENMGDLFFYENIGNPTTPNFVLRTKNYLDLAFGMYAGDKPQLVDINADSKTDLFINTATTLAYLQNQGSAISPNFQLITNYFQGIFQQHGIWPSFGDLNGNGSYDLICGTTAIPGPPALSLYANAGTPRNPNFQLTNPQYITNPNIFAAAKPTLADIDGDSALDLFISDDDGHFFYYHNTGTPQIANFVLVDSQWQGIQFAYPYNGRKTMAFVDMDGDGDLDLIMTGPYSFNVTGNLMYYRNTGTPQIPNMVMVTQELLQNAENLFMPTPYLTDIDGDGDYDLFVGNLNGGIQFFRNITPSPVHPDPKHRAPTEPIITILPNPGNSTIAASYVLRAASQVSLKVYDIEGRLTGTLFYGFQLPGTYNVKWDATEKASGIYLMQLETSNQTTTRKVTIVK